MSNSIYNLLGFPTNDPVLSAATVTLSDDVKTQMNLAPSLVNSWQQADIANNSTTGYFSNPNQIGNDTTNTACQLILSVNSGVTGNTTTITNLLSAVRTKATTLSTSTVPGFEYHTQRMSNMVTMGSDMTHPHYELSIGYGKMMMFITNKTDGIEDNSPMIGSFGSIFAANVINANANTYLAYAQLYANTITVTSVDDGFGNITITYNSNISLSNAQSLSDSANNVYNLMTTYKTQDTTFFTNTKSVVDAYNNVTTFSRLGQTENDLIMNHIGSDKIKTRLSS